MKKAAIIGAGIGGLGAAIRLTLLGYEVTVFEKQAIPGGKLGLVQQKGYRYDLGPSLFTMPQYVDALFELAGEDPRAHFEYQKLPVVCHYFWEDGSVLNAFADNEKFASEAQLQLGADPSDILATLADAKYKYDACGALFLENSLHKSSTWRRWEVIPALLKTPFLGLFHAMDTANGRLNKHPKMRQLFNRFATYNGSDPYKTPGLLSMIPHFEHGFGAFYPKGGMYSITEAVFGLAKRLGVKFHFNTEVDRISVEKNIVSGVIVAKKQLLFDTVVSNMDVFFTYKKLLADQAQPEKTLTREKSSSGIVFYWGIKREFASLGLHNIFFSENYENEFAQLAQGKLSDDPTVYLNISSKLTPTDAPEGCENWFLLINAPYDAGQDWALLVAQTRQNVLDKLSRILKIDIESLIESETVLDPRSIETQTGSHKGALYGTSSNSKWSAFWRHPNFSTTIKQLYFVGGSVHPGGGIPLALLSAKIVGDIVSAAEK